MVASVVFIFLLDHLPEHKNHLVTYDDPFPFHGYQDRINDVQQCDAYIADPLVQIASKALHAHLQPYWKNAEESIETVGNYTRHFDESVEKADDGISLKGLLINKIEEGFSSVEYARFIEKFENELPLQFDKNGKKSYFSMASRNTTTFGAEKKYVDDVNDTNIYSNDKDYGAIYVNSGNYIDINNGSRINNSDDNPSEHIYNNDFHIPSDIVNNAYDVKDKHNFIESNTTNQNQNIDKIDFNTSVTNNTNLNNVQKESSTEVAFESNTVNAVFPKTIPYLVAIFESLDNVTAQTCGGTLVAPEWVLTAYTCLNVLGNMYNATEVRASSNYTVIVNATNPLLDGSVHNVTEILQSQPLTSLESFSPIGKVKQPLLALMRIEPKVEIDEVQTEGVVTPGGLAVMVYGWALVKNELGRDELHATSYRAVTLSPLQCRLLGHPDNNTVCLTIAEEDGSDSQMTSGSPVVGLTASGPQLLAIAVSEAHPMLAAPLAAHARWLGSVLHA